MIDHRISLLTGRLLVAALMLTMIAVPVWRMVGNAAAPAATKGRTLAIPRAGCAAGDRTEQVQGQTTLAERFAPGPARAYNCNLELVGQYQGEGAAADIEASGACAYYSTVSGPDVRNPGVVVLDLARPAAPAPAAFLTSPAMLTAHESLEIAQSRKLLLASDPRGGPVSTFDIYDISDCRHPVLRSSLPQGDALVSHDGKFSADGLTFFGAKWNPKDPKIFAIDVADPAKPHLVSTWAPGAEQPGWSTHGVFINKTATRAYVSLKRMSNDRDPAVNPNGLAIFDISAITARKPGASFKLITSLFWDDAHGSEGMTLATIGGKPYLVFSDNMGALGMGPVNADTCASGKPGHGYARLIDLSNERQPRVASRMILEVSDPINCSKSLNDPLTYGGYGSFSCSVDNPADTRLVACGYFEAGLRVFDVRKPQRPREIAYYKPPAQRTRSMAASIFRVSDKAPPDSVARDHSADSVVVAPLFRGNGREIWFTSADNGFQVVRFSNAFVTANRGLFSAGG